MAGAGGGPHMRSQLQALAVNVFARSHSTANARLSPFPLTQAASAVVNKSDSDIWNLLYKYSRDLIHGAM